MNSRTIAILAALVVIVLAAAVWTSMSRQPGSERNGALYPALKGQLDRVRAVRIFGPGNQLAVEIARDQNDWSINERSQYPAAGDKVRQLLLDLSEASTIEEKTSNPANYPALGVEDTSDSTASGVRVELVGPTGIDVIVGKTGAGAHSRYVRKTTEQSSWLVDRALEAPSDPQDWLDTRLLDIAADRIQSARIEIEGKQPYTAAKENPTDTHFTVANLKKGQTLNDASAADGVASSLVSLNLEDVAPYTQWQGKRPQAQAIYETFDGLTVELSGWHEDETHHIHARIRYDEEQAQRFAPQSDDKNQAGNATPDRKAEAAALDARLRSWTFQIPDYKYEAIFEPLEDLLKK